MVTVEEEEAEKTILKQWLGRQYRVWLKTGHSYAGMVCEENETHITIDDERTGRLFLVAKDFISTAMLLDEPGGKK